MPIRAQAADGTIHEFPDGTRPEAVDRAMRGYAQSKGGGKAPAKGDQSFSQAFFGKMGRDMVGLMNPALTPIVGPMIDKVVGANTVRDFTQRAVQPITLNAADEVVSAVPAAAAARRGQPVKQTFSQSQRQQSQERAKIQRERPKLATVADLTGGAASLALPIPAAGGFIKAAPNLMQTALRTGAVGAGQGYVGGFLAGEEGDRLDSAGTGAMMGAAIGAGLPYAAAIGGNALQRAAPVVQGFMQRAAPMVEGVGRAVPAVDDLAGNLATRMRGMGPPAPSSLSTPEQIALRHINRNLQSSGMSIDDLRAAPDSIMAAEAMGRTGQRQLGALARMEGQTGDNLAARIAERRVGRPELLKEEFGRATGVAPDDAMGAIQSVVAKGRADAAPLYDAAYEAGPFDSPVLNGLMGRPSLKRAMNKAYRLAAEEGENPEALGLVNMDNMDQWAVTNPADFGDAQTAVQKAVRGPSRAPSRGPSLIKFLADNGGIDDVGGDLAAMDAGSWHKGKAFQRPLIGKVSADDAALRAWEAGYFPGRQERPDINELLDAVSREMRGQPTYARAADQGAADRFAARNAADEAAYYGFTGEDAPTEADYGLRPEPVGEPVFASLPTAKTWDYVKRGLDEVLEGYRDTTTGRLPNTNEVRAVQKTLKDLRSELISASPAYGQALNVSSDYLGAQDAFYRSQKLFLNPNVTEQQFAKNIGDLTGAEKSAFRAGIANQMFDSAQNGNLDPRLFKAARVREKMRLIFGEENAQSLISTLERETQKAAFENRYGPGAGSISADMLAGGEELAQSVGGGPLNLGRMAMNPVQTIKAGGEALINRAYSAATQPGQAAARDAIGQRYMMSPQELADYLQANPINVPPPMFPGPRAPNPFAFTAPPPRAASLQRR